MGLLTFIRSALAIRPEARAGAVSGSVRCGRAFDIRPHFVPFADHQTERGPEIAVGDGERGLGFSAERGTAPESGRRVDAR
jgi:hypothetical protein